MDDMIASSLEHALPKRRVSVKRHVMAADDATSDEYRCPPPCICQVTEAYCDGSGLTSVPDDLPDDLTKVMLKDNHIKRLKVKQMGHLVYLKSINLRGNDIRHIEPGVFEKMNNLKALTFRDNSLKAVGKLTFLGLNNLQQLSLRNNKLRHIEGALDGLHHLELLSLGENKLTHLTSKTFAGNGRLKILDLHNNTIVHIHKDAFLSLHVLKFLILNDNPLKFVDLNFKQNFHLELLDFTNCKLKQMVQGLPSSIRDLRIGENEIRYNCQSYKYM